MKNFTLKSSRQFVSTEVLLNLKKRIQVLVIVLVGFLGVSQSAYAFDIPASTTYYFDNSQTQWTSTNVYFYVGHASYLRSYQMTQVGSTDIYSITMAAWSGATAVFFANTAGGISGGSSSFNVGSIPATAAPRTANYTSLPTASYYFIPWGTQATNNPNTSIGGEWKANLNVPANVLSGTDVMFYINQSYAGTLGVTNSSSSTCIATTSLTSLSTTDKYLSMAAANVPSTLSVSNNCGGWSGNGAFTSQTSTNAAGAYYITGATISKTSASVSASPSSASISFGTTSINLTATTAAATSAYGRNMYIQYYIDGATTPTLTSSKVSSTTTVTSYNTSALAIGTHTIIPVMTDRLVFLKGASFTVTVTSSCPTITVTPSATPSATGTVGTAYTSVTFSASGGVGPYTYALNSGTLPAGLTLNSSTGVLSGTPTTAASYTFAIKATDANTCVGTVGSYTVVISCATITVTPSATPSSTGTVGTAYTNVTFSASGGVGSYTYALNSGTLPAGLTLNSSTGVLSGTPTTAASYTFAVKATDANTCVGTVGSYTVVISACTVGTWLGGTSVDWNTAANWSCATIPTSTTNVTIPSGTTYSPNISSAAALANSVTINASAALTMSGGNTLTISSGGSFTNNNTFNRGDGTVIFAGSGTITGTVVFNNITLSGAVTNGSAVTVNGTLQINSGGSLSTAPTYDCNSLLKYNSGSNPQRRGNEWTSAAVPGNVQISNNTTMDADNVGGTGSQSATICGTLTIDSGSSFYMDYGGGSGSLTIGKNIVINGNLSLGGATLGDLSIGGNFTHATGSVNYKGRTVTFNGATGDQTITSSSGETFPYVTINKATSGNVVLANATTISQSLILTKGLLVLGNNSLTLGGTTTSASTSSYIATTGSGKVIKVHTGSFDYPVGPNTTNYAPVTINNTGASQTYTIGVANTTYTPTADGSNWQWSIAASGTSSSNLSFKWFTADSGANLNATPSIGVPRNYNGSSWVGSTGSTSTGSPNVTTVNGITNFTNTLWTVITPCTVSTAAVLSGTATICSGASTNLQVAITGGTSPYTVVYYNGTSNITVNSYVSGTNIPVSPTATTTYSLVSVTGAAGCAGTGNSGTPTVTVSTTNTWIGGTSIDWNTAANWCGGVPTSASNVVIPSGTTYSPSIYQTANAVANSITINSLASLSMSNAYSLSVTGGGFITNSGTFNAGDGTVNFAGSGTITGTISFYNVNLNGAVSFSNAVTVNNRLRISSGGAVTTNSPTYGSSSLLQYYSGGSYNRNLEWNATSGAGYPNNVTVENNTVLNVKNGDNSYKKIAGNLTITTGSTFKITDMTTGTPSALGVTGISVEVLGDILNNGTITSNGTTNTRLKGNNFVNGYSNATATTTLSGNFGGDLEVAGNFTNNAVFTVSQRAVFFTGTTTQVVDGTAVAPFNIDYVVVAKNPGSGTVLLNKDLLVSGPLTGQVIKFISSSDVIDLNGHTLTVGTSGVINTISGPGLFKGSASSNMIINGVGDIGTINFDQTTLGTSNVLNNLTLNRTSTGGGFTLGNDVNVLNTTTLTAGVINLSSANMTIGASGSIAVTSPDATKMIIASGTGELRKTFTAAGSFTYPVGDNVGTAEYSPATLTFSGSPSGYAGVRVQNAKHPNINVGISDYITRYWPVSSTISGPNCTAAFTYLAADENGTPANYFGGRYLSPDWYCMDDVDQVSRIISKTGLTAFGDFTVYNPPVMTSTLTSSAATICANTSTNLQVTIGGGDSPYTVGPFTVVYYDSVLATNVTVNSYTSGANIPVSPTASTTYTLQSVTSSKACYSSASDTKTVSIGGTSTYASGSWTPSAPVSTSTAIIDGGTYNVAANIDACSLEVKNSAVVTIPSTYKVTLSGALTVETGSSFTLENDTNLVQTGGTTNPNTGSIRVKRNSSSLYLLDYTLWSSSVANQNLYSFSPDTAANRFYIYDEPTDQYNSLSSNNSFTVGRGYLIRVPRTFSATTPGVFTGIFTGKPNSGDITYGMSKSLNGFNAVGNPYPSQINVHNFIDANISNIQGTLYFWRKRNNPLATSYATLTKLAYAANAAAGGDTGSTYYNTMTTPAADWVINVGQGFFVQAKSASNLVFTNTMRRGTNNGNQFFRTSNKLVEDPNTFKLNLTSTNGVFSQMVLGYSPEYTLGIDDGIDGFNINSTNYLCSTIEGAAYVIQGRPEFSATDVVPLEYKIENADQYSIAIEQLSGVFASQDVFLKDKLTNTIHDLKSGPYDFSSESGNFKERFEVVYENPLAVNQPRFTENTVIVYKQNQELVVNTGKIPMSSVKVYDIRGRLLIAKDRIDATQVKLFTGTTQEVLLVKITSDSYGTVTKKVVN